MKNRLFWVFLCLVIVAGVLIINNSGTVQAQDKDEIYIIGIVEPLNKTELPGHIEFPYYGEVMEKVLTSSENNYVVKQINEEKLEEAGYRFSSITPDADLQPSQIEKLCDNNRLDALLIGRIELIERNLEPRFMAEAGRIMEFKMEGILYDRYGRKIWNKSIQDNHEFTREKGKFKPPFETQMVNFYVDIINKLSASMLSAIGRKNMDREPPVIQFENVSSGDKIRTSCIVLKGKVSDNSKVDSIIVNGQAFPLRRPMKEVDMFYPIHVPHGRPGQNLKLVIEARDIYGFSYAKEINLKWDNPVKGIVTSINPDTISIGLSPADFKRTPVGQGFWIYGVNEFRDPLSSHRMRMFTVDKIGPVVVIKRFPEKNVVQAVFFKGQEHFMDQVKKDDIAK